MILLAVYWLSTISQSAVEAEEWLQVVFKQLGAVKQPYLPSTWTAKGIVAAMRYDIGKSVFYLLVVLGNAAFLSWVTINLLGRYWAEAYSRRTTAGIARRFATAGSRVPSAGRSSFICPSGCAG